MCSKVVTKKEKKKGEKKEKAKKQTKNEPEVAGNEECKFEPTE